MHEVTTFGFVVLLVSLALAAALASQVVSERLSIPPPAIFLIVAAIASDVIPALALSPRDIERVAVIALIMILFDGGMQIGWRRFRSSAAAIVGLGIAGTFITAGLIFVAAHWLLGVSWSVAGMLAAALAPTDPAVLFSVLGNREVGGRSGTILEGESGANDPVGIALMLGVLAYVDATTPTSSPAPGRSCCSFDRGGGRRRWRAGAAAHHPTRIAAEREPVPAADAGGGRHHLRPRQRHARLRVPGRLHRRNSDRRHASAVQG